MTESGNASFGKRTTKGYEGLFGINRTTVKTQRFVSSALALMDLGPLKLHAAYLMEYPMAAVEWEDIDSLTDPKDVLNRVRDWTFPHRKPFLDELNPMLKPLGFSRTFTPIEGHEETQLVLVAEPLSTKIKPGTPGDPAARQARMIIFPTVIFAMITDMDLSLKLRMEVPSGMVVGYRQRDGTASVSRSAFDLHVLQASAIGSLDSAMDRLKDADDAVEGRLINALIRGEDAATVQKLMRLG